LNTSYFEYQLRAEWMYDCSILWSLWQSQRGWS